MKDGRMRKLERVLIFFICAAVLLSVGTLKKQKAVHKTSELQVLNEGWYYMQGRKKIPVTLPCTIELEKNKNLNLYYDHLTVEDGSHTICTKGAEYKMRMQMVGSFLYDYSEEGFARNRQMRSKLDCLAILPENPKGKSLILTYRNQGDNIFHVNPVYLGRSAEILQKLWYSDAFMILCVFTFSITGMVCAGAWLYLKNLKMPENRMGSASIFLLLCSVWCFLDSSLAQQLMDQSPIVCLISMFAFMVMPIPLMHFVSRTEGMENYQALGYYNFLLYGNLLLQCAMHIAWQVDFVKMLPLTHLVHGGACILILHVLSKEYRISGKSELKAMLQALFVLFCAVAVDVVFYWAKPSPYYGVLFEAGVLVFIVRLLGAILMSMASNVQFKAEAMVYKRLSREDRLTGLGNRRGFDDALADIEKDPGHDDYALVFMDVNRLKLTNDRFGHGAGDELIIGAARCMEQTFMEQGTYYRIGGDEFAAIIPHPDSTEEQWARRLQESIDQFNYNCRYHLAIAWGISFLRQPDGKVKRLSDWKFEADQAMYARKQDQEAHDGQGSSR